MQAQRRRSVFGCFLCLWLVGCSDFVLMPTYEPGADPSCKALPIGQNIIGNWQYGRRKSRSGDTLAGSVPLTTAYFTHFGRITFEKNTNVIDPDSLVENRLSGFGPVVAKRFSLEPNPDYPLNGNQFWIWQYIKDKDGVTRWGQKYYLDVISNTCNRIHLRGDAFEVVMIRQ